MCARITVAKLRAVSNIKKERAAIHVCFRKRPLPKEEETDCLVLTKDNIKLCNPKSSKQSRSFNINRLSIRIRV